MGGDQTVGDLYKAKAILEADLKAKSRISSPMGWTTFPASP